jgi:hypothetical protein
MAWGWPAWQPSRVATLSVVIRGTAGTTGATRASRTTGTRRGRRRALALATLAAATLAVSGCGNILTAPTGDTIDTQSQFWYDPADGASADVDDLGLRNVVVVAGSNDDATVLVAVANAGSDDDQLVAVSLAGSQGEFSEGPVDLPAGTTTQIGYPSEDTILVEGVGADVAPGLRVDVGFTFSDASSVTVNTIVQPADDVYLRAAPPGSELVVEERVSAKEEKEAEEAAETLDEAGLSGNQGDGGVGEEELSGEDFGSENLDDAAITDDLEGDFPEDE